MFGGDSVEQLLVREPEARKALGGISRSKLWELRKSGLIETISIGAARLYPVDALKRFVDARRALAGDSGGQD
jgi:hypothetical protein